MPACAIKHDYGMCPWNDGFGDFGEVFIHRLRIGKGHDEGGGSGAFRTDGSKYVSPFVASITWRSRAGSAPGPNTGERSLLSDPRFILEPDFQWFAAGFRRQCRRYQLREVFF